VQSLGERRSFVPTSEIINVPKRLTLLIEDSRNSRRTFSRDKNKNKNVLFGYSRICVLMPNAISFEE